MLRKDHLQHLLVGLGIQAVVWAAWAACGLAHGSIVGAIAAVAYFWGREGRDHEIIVTQVQHRYPNLRSIPVLDRIFFWRWCRDGRWDLLCPTVGVVLVALVDQLWRLTALFGMARAVMRIS